MKLQNTIKRIEKATGKKIEKNGNMFFLTLPGKGNNLSFFENGEGSGNVRTICVTMKNGDDNPWNGNCYNSFYRTLKHAINAVS